MRAKFLFGGSRGETVYLPAPSSYPYYMASGPPSPSKPVMMSWVLLTLYHSDLLIHIFFWPLSASLFHFILGPSSNPGQTPSVGSLISILNFSLPCTLICSKVLGIRLWASLRVIILPTTTLLLVLIFKLTQIWTVGAPLSFHILCHVTVIFGILPCFLA